MWILFCLLSAVCDAARNTFNKSLSGSLKPGWINFSLFLFAVPVYLALLAGNGMPNVQPAFWGYFLVHILLELFSTLALTRALRLGEISMVSPLLGTSGIFLVLPGLFLPSGAYSLQGVFGATLVAIGVYLCHCPSLRPRSLFAGLRAILSNHSCQLGLVVAMLWAMDGKILQLGARASSWQYLLFLSSVTVALLFAILLRLRKEPAPSLSEIPWRKITLVGITSAGSLSLMMFALSVLSAPVGYVISLKRLSIVFGMLAGFVFFKEPATPPRITGGLVTIIGAVMIALAPQ